MNHIMRRRPCSMVSDHELQKSSCRMKTREFHTKQRRLPDLRRCKKKKKLKHTGKELQKQSPCLYLSKDRTKLYQTSQWTSQTCEDCSGYLDRRTPADPSRKARGLQIHRARQAQCQRAQAIRTASGTATFNHSQGLLKRKLASQTLLIR